MKLYLILGGPCRRWFMLADSVTLKHKIQQCFFCCIFTISPPPNLFETLPHEADHRVHVCDSCLVSPEYLSPRILVQREPRAVLLNQLIAATGIEYVHVIPAHEHM